jgi:predicted transcriptional regulator
MSSRRSTSSRARCGSLPFLHFEAWLTFHPSRALEREKSNLIKERDRSSMSQHAVESELHRQQLQESELRSQLKERDALEQKIASDRARLVDLNSRAKVCSYSALAHAAADISLCPPQNRNWMDNWQRPQRLFTPWKKSNENFSLN